MELDTTSLLKVINHHFIESAQEPISYTKAYFWWKKFHNISHFFKEELMNKNGPVKVIDAGCGLGSHVFYLNHSFGKAHNLEFYGVDLDPSKIYYCKLRKESYKSKNITFDTGKVECLNFPDNSFDILLSIEVLEHLREPERAINEFYRVLKPGGLVIITTPNKATLVLRFKKLLRLVCPTLWKADSGYLKAAEELNYSTLDDDYKKISYEHISVNSLNNWIKILQEHKFRLEKIRRGSLLLGRPSLDQHRFIFAFILLIEVLLDRLPFLYNLSEDAILSARKV